MNPPPKETLLIAIITAVLGGIMVLRNIDSILQHIKRLLNVYAEYWRLRGERERQQLEESRLRAAWWVQAIQIGIAEQKLSELNKRIRSQQNENKNRISDHRDHTNRP